MSGTQPRSMPSSAPRTARSSARPTTSRADGNWEHHTILHRNRAPALLSDAEEQRLAGLRAKLKAVRDKRVWPGWDDKVLADWNGLMIAALANASAVFQRDDWLAAATRAWRFIMDTMRDDDGRLFHSHRAGKRLHRGTLDDYANMARAGIALFEVTGETRYLDEAQALIAVLDRHFADPTGGAYFIDRRRCGRPDRARQALPRQRRARRQRHAGRRVRAAVGADRRGALARQGAGAGGGFRGRARQQLLPADDAAQRLRDVAERRRDGAGRRSQCACRPRRCAVRSTPRACPTRSCAASHPTRRLPANHPAAGKGLVDGKPALYVCRNMSLRARRSPIRRRC